MDSPQARNDPMVDAPPLILIVISSLYRLAYYGAFVVLLHFVASTGIRTEVLYLQLLAVLPATVALWHWLVPLGGLVQFLGIPLLGKMKWPNQWTTRLVRLSFTLFVSNSIILASLFTVNFAAWTAFWYKRGVVVADPVLQGDVLSSAEQFYLWNLADSVPSLEVTDTVQWELDANFTGATSGALPLLFKATVILPIVYGFVGLLAQLWENMGNSVPTVDAATTIESS